MRVEDIIMLPVHISNNAPSTLDTILTMTSDSEMEVRILRLIFHKDALIGGEDVISKEALQELRLK